MSHRVSIGLPVFNGAEFLDQTLQALLAQDYEDFELMIIDDASTDATEAIARQAAEGDSRVRHHKIAKHGGAAHAYRQAVVKTTGEYFRWASPDDIVDPRHLRRSVEILDQAPEDVGLVYTQTSIISAQGEFLRTYDEHTDLRAADVEDRLRLLLTNLRICNSVYGLARRTALLKTALIGDFSGADEVFVAEMACHGQIWEIPERLYQRRLHQGGYQFNSENANGEEALMRQFQEYGAAIRRARLPKDVTIRCMTMLFKIWLPGHWERMSGELKVRFKNMLTPRALQTT